MDNLPYEILEKIVSNLNFGTAVRVCRKWRDIAERSKKKFKELSVDLAKVEDPNDLNDFAPSILNVTCSMLELPDSVINDYQIQKVFNNIYNNDEYYKDNNKLVKLFKSLARLREIEKLDLLKIKTFLFITNEEIKHFIDKRFINRCQYDYLVEIIMTELFEIKTKKIHVKINDDNLKDFLLHYSENDIEKFTDCLKRIIQNEQSLKHIFTFCSNVGVFIFDALYGEYLIYDDKTQNLTYRFGDYRKCMIDGSISKSITEQLFHKEKYWLDIFIDALSCSEIYYKFNKIHVYNINIDDDILFDDLVNIEYIEIKFFYFGNIENVIFPFELEIKEGIFTAFIDRSEIVMLDERDFEKYDLENMLLNF